MQNTYTYTARNVDDPAQVVTFTLHDKWLSVDIGAPLEHLERTVNALKDHDNARNVASSWLKPLAVSLIQRKTQPFRISDIKASAEEDELTLKSWTRMGGLRLNPITLMRGRVDNPDAAHAFVAELNRRREAESTLLPGLGLLNYWGTWVVAALSLFGSFLFWRNRAQGESES